MPFINMVKVKQKKGGSMKFNNDNNKALTEYMTLLDLVQIPC